MSAAACAKKILCKNKAQNQLKASYDNLDNLDKESIFSDEQIAKWSEYYITAVKMADNRIMKDLAAFEVAGKGKDGRDHF